MSEHQWYYVKEGLLNPENIGPLAEADFALAIKAGDVNPKTTVASPTRTKGQWCLLDQFPPLVKMWEEGEATRQQQTAANADAKAQQKAADQAQARDARAQSQLANEQALQARQQQVGQISDSTNLALVEKIQTNVAAILTAGEVIDFITIQAKPVAIKADAVVATDRRLIFYRPKLLGRFDFTDYLWRDLQDAHLAQNIIGATFTATSIHGQVVSMDYLNKDSATRLYRMAQQKEEEAIEVRRQREMEERAAGASNISVQAAPQQTVPAPAATPVGGDMVARLKQLKEMLEMDLITQEDFDRRKDEIIADV